MVFVFFFSKNEFGTTLPVELQRVVDILSIKYTKLKGTKTNHQTDFEKYGNWDQSTIGVNLGAEIMFIYDYDNTASYRRSDFVREGGKYGYVRGQHLDDLMRIFGPYMTNGTKYKGDVVTEQWVVDKYETQNIIIKLKDKLRVGIDEMYVLCEDSSSNYSVVEVRAQNFLEQTTYDVELLDNKYVITNPGSADHSGFDEDRRHNEIMSDASISDELISFDDGLLTVMSALEHLNPTLILYRDRTYKFKIDSMGDGIEIVPDLGEDARLTGFVSGQGTEIGTIILRTDEDEIHGPIPEKIYYRSVNDRSKSGMIIIKDVNDVDGYSTEFRGVTAYNIDITYNSRDQLQRLGWGVDIPDGANAWQFYSLYEYNPTANTEQYHVGNVIDWTSSTASLRDAQDGGRTTIEYDQVETFGDWSADGAIADIVIEKTLRDGLSLFDGLDPVGDHYK